MNSAVSTMSRSEQLPTLVASKPAADAGAPPSDTGRAVRVGLWALVLGFGGFLLWAVLAPIDEGVPAQGIVTIDTKTKVVQHLNGGIVKRVLVHEGQVVEAGQPLLELDDALARANHEGVRQRYLSLRAVQARLLTEQAGSDRITFHPDLVAAAATDPLIRAQMQAQEQLFRARKAALNADVQAYEESIRGQEGSLAAYRDMLESRRMQLSLLQDELKHTRELVSDGYAPRNRQLELERSSAEVATGIADLNGNIVRAQRSITELRQRIQARRQQQRTEIEAQLTETTRDVLSDAERLPAVADELERTVIRAPVAGQVIGLAVQTVGGVVQPGQRLMEIVPEGAPLLLEARIDPHMIDRVHPGLLTDVRFNAFAHSPQLVVQGRVVSVSGDLLSEQRGGAAVSYYLARVEVTPEGMHALGGRRMQPGMSAEVVIRTGERTLLTYLWSPLAKRMAASMTEE